MEEKNFYNKNFINLFSKETIDRWMTEDLIEFKRSDIISKPEIEKEYIYLIVDGEANIFLIHEDGKECIINILGKGEFIQLFDIFTNVDSNIIAKPLSDLTIARVKKSDIRNELLNDSEISLKILNDFSLRLQDMVEILSQVAYGKVENRLMFLLEKLANKEKIIAGWAPIDIYITHQDMASMIASTRETVTLLINRLRKEKLLKQEDEKIWINLNDI